MHNRSHPLRQCAIAVGCFGARGRMREGEDLHRSRVISRLDDNGGLRDDDRVLVDFLDTLLLDLHNAEAAKGLRPGRFRSISRLSTASPGAQTLRSLQGGLGRAAAMQPRAAPCFCFP